MNTILHSINDIIRLTLKSLGLLNSESNNNFFFNPPNTKLPNAESNKFNDLFNIIKHGNREEIVKVIQAHGYSVFYEKVSQTDDTIIHWGCLSGNLDVLKFLKDYHEKNNDKKDEWSTLINSKNTLMQTPLHWACTIENLSMIQFLLKEGADINAMDTKGVTPLIMCSQYGNISGAIFLISNGAKIFLTDLEGDNALHWALYKGYAELARLLIFFGLNCDQKDNYGQTPLHFACLSGNIGCVADLVEKDNVEINVHDNNNKTPLMLAAGRKYWLISEYLKYHIKIRVGNLSCLTGIKYKIMGNPNKNRIPLLFFLMCTLLWGNPYYFCVIRPHSIDHAQFLNLLFVICQCGMWISFMLTSFRNPGYIQQSETNYNSLIYEIKSLENFKNIKIKDYSNPINKICHSCKVVKPIRARHCKICDRCVDEMDHHCPYVGNCIGKRNRFWFLFFIISMNLVNILAGYLFYVAYLKSALVISAAILTVLLICFGLLLGFTINFFMCKQAISNITLLESQKWKRYNYLQNGNGSFYNPFDQGWFSNLLSFFNVKTSNLVK